MRPYVHKIWCFENGEIGDVYDVVVTKKAFKERMLDHFFGDGAGTPLVFQLQDSPNKAIYRIVPYVNRRKNADICFQRLEEQRI